LNLPLRLNFYSLNPIRFRKILLPLYAVLLIVSVFFLLKLRVQYNFEHFFPKEDPAYQLYADFRREFPVDDRMLILAVKANNGIFNPPFLDSISVLEQSLVQEPFVEEVTSLQNLRIPVKTPLGFIRNPVLSRNEEKLIEDSIRLVSNPSISSYYLSKNQDYYAIYIGLADSTSDMENRAIIKGIQNRIIESGFTQYHLAGFLYTQVSYTLLLENEIPYTSALVACALAFILFLLYRSWANTILLTSIVLIGLVLFFGYLGLIGRTLNITSTLFITIMIIVGISDIIHLQTYYHKYLAQQYERINAIQKALKEVWLNLLLTSVTTAAGFLTFLSSSIPHISTFGIDAAVGVTIAFIIAVTLAPVLFYYFPPTKVLSSNTANEIKWERFLNFVYHSGKNKSSLVLIITIIITSVSLLSLPFMETNQTLSGNFANKHQIKKDIEFFESQFGGIRGFELWVKPEETYRLTDTLVLNAIDSLSQYLNNSGHFGPVFSPVSWLELSHQMNTGFRDPNATFPRDSTYINYLLEADIDQRRYHFFQNDLNSARIVSKMKDVGKDSALVIQQAMFDLMGDKGLSKYLKAEITGSAILIDQNNKNINNEMFYSLGIAFAFISLLMGLLFRRWLMVLISIIPNLVPLLAVGLIMSVSGIPLNAATSLIFTIGFVIAIDDTIHFLTRFKNQYETLGDLEESIKSTMSNTGRAIVYTSIILFAGYGILVVSSFKEIMHHAILVCTTLFFALLADLYLLPALLRVFAKRL
jgi:uncharacterized protein